MAVEILSNTIIEYISPFLNAAGIVINPDGFLIENGKRICMKNSRYNEDNPQGESPVLYPCIPLNDDHYLEIKESTDLEIFNPFENIRHMCIVAIKMKKLLAVSLNKELVDSIIKNGEDDYDKLDEYIGLSNNVNNEGVIEYQLIDTSNGNVMLEYKCPRDEPIKGLYGICALIYNNYVSIRPPFLKKYENIEWGWKKIHSAMNKWDKLKKTIVVQIKKNNNESMNIDYMDLSDSVSPDAAVSIYNMPKVYTDDDYVGTNCEDINDPEMLKFMLTLFDPNDLKLYKEPEPTNSSENITPSSKMEVTNNENKVIEQPAIEEKVVSKSAFKRVSDNSNYNNQYGMMNPMIGYGNFNNNLPSLDLNDMILDDIIDPYKMYR